MVTVRSMRDQLRNDLPRALKARDRTAVSALRSAIAAIDNAEAVEARDHATQRAANSSHVAGASLGAGSSDVPRRTLSDAEIHAIVIQQVEERRQAAREYVELGRADAGQQLDAEADSSAAIYSHGRGGDHGPACEITPTCASHLAAQPLLDRDRDPGVERLGLRRLDQVPQLGPARRVPLPRTRSRQAESLLRGDADGLRPRRRRSP